ncbi:hypothetical protein [Massilia horti]|uniref:hypothetical protein n=1 Tax=Massilia horti TaxID=2562153 RepID=UPI001430C45A|nr:hypothetical protein [Massilia horti]
MDVAACRWGRGSNAEKKFPKCNQLAGGNVLELQYKKFAENPQYFADRPPARRLPSY